MRTLVIAGVLVASLAVAFGAEIKKKNGTVVQGEIVAEDADGVTVRNRLGEARIERSDIESIDRGAAQSVEERLEKIKAETIERLKALADAASSEKRKDAAQAIREAVEEAKRWSTKPAEPRVEEPRPTPAPPSGMTPPSGMVSPAATSDTPRPLDFSDVLRRWEKLRADPTATSVVRDRFCAEMQRRAGRATMKVVDVTRRGDSFLVHGTVDGVAVQATFDELTDSEKLMKLKPGASISVVGTIRLELQVELLRCRLR